MNTPSNKVKAQFFALYIGQNCRRMLNETVMFPPDKVNGAVITNISDGKYPESYVELRDLDQLTDEEKQIIGKFIFKSATWENKDVVPYLIRSIRYYSLDYKLGQLLISFGLLIPFTYLSEDNKPVTLSPNEIINLGWAKVKAQ